MSLPKPYYQDEYVTIYHADCRDILPKIPCKSIELVLTSPPYDNLREYGKYNWDFKATAQELFRVLLEGGMVVWVVGDETNKFCESLSSFRQAIYFVESCGLNLLDTMIYYKKNYAPAYPTLKRYANQFEYMFIFSKGSPKTFNPVQKEKVRNKEEKVAYRQRDGSLKRKTKQKGRETKDASNIWEFAVGGNLTGHPAVFPEQLANDHIRSWSNPNNLILDPFLGSGTTAYCAKKLNRKCIGIEIEEKYCEIAARRCSQDVMRLNV
jgi:DNA modification methylase